MTERKYPVRDSGPMYNFPVPTETLRAELAEAHAMIDAALMLHAPLDYVHSADGPALCAECLDEFGEPAAYPCDTAKALGVTGDNAEA